MAATSSLTGLRRARLSGLLLLSQAAPCLSVADPSCDASGDALLQTRARKDRVAQEPAERLELRVPPESLMELQAGGNATAFGPDGCVSLSSTKDGTCEITTNCKGRDLSDTEFAFVCINPSNAQPYTLHTYGKGGFNVEESFDTGIECDRCATVTSAFAKHGPLASSARSKADEDLLKDSNPEPPPPEPTTTTTTTTELETAYFGPDGCFATWLSNQGTCIVRTKCKGKDISKFNPGLTCTDKAGGYTRYYLGLNTFEDEETFDSTLKCEACVGVGDDSGKQVTGLLPKNMLQEFGILEQAVSQLKRKADLQDALSEKIGAAIKQWEDKVMRNISDWEKSIAKDVLMSKAKTAKEELSNSTRSSKHTEIKAAGGNSTGEADATKKEAVTGLIATTGSSATAASGAASGSSAAASGSAAAADVQLSTNLKDLLKLLAANR